MHLHRARRPNCLSYFNIYSSIDPIAWIVSPVVEHPSESLSLATVKSYEGRDPPKIPLPRALPGASPWDDVIRFLRKEDRRGDTDQLIVRRGGVITGDTLYAASAHSCYFLSEEVAFFVLTQLLAPWALAQALPPPRNDPALLEREIGDRGPSVSARLEIGTPLSHRSQITGLHTPVLAVLQRLPAAAAGNSYGGERPLFLYVYTRDSRAMPQQRGVIPLRDALLSSPPMTARNARGARINVQAATRGLMTSKQHPHGRLYELYVNESEEGARWMEALGREVAPRNSMDDRTGDGDGEDDGGGSGSDDGGGDWGQGRGSEGVGSSEERGPRDHRDSFGSSSGRRAAPKRAARDDGWGSRAFFGATKVGLLQKRGEGTMSRWHTRWFALHGGSVQYYDRPPSLLKPRVALNVTHATLRVYEASLLLAWDSGDGRVLWLKSDGIDTLRRWAETCAALAIEVDWRAGDRGAPATDVLLVHLAHNRGLAASGLVDLAALGLTPGGGTAAVAAGGLAPLASPSSPSSSGTPNGFSTPSRRGDAGQASLFSPHSSQRHGSRWRVFISGFEVQQDAKSSYAAFTVNAMQHGHSYVTHRRYSEFVALHKRLLRTVTVPSVLPQLPATRLFNKLETKYLNDKEKKLQNYLLALVALGGDAETSSSGGAIGHAMVGQAQPARRVDALAGHITNSVLRAVQVARPDASKRCSSLRSQHNAPPTAHHRTPQRTDTHRHAQTRTDTSPQRRSVASATEWCARFPASSQDVVGGFLLGEKSGESPGNAHD